VNHIIYLGGLQPQARKISKHLRSRAEVGEILRSHCSTTEFRAGPIIGSGSASFEMNRYLTERLPVMITPRWIFNPVQTLAIGDLLAYLTAALDHPPLGIVEIGSTPVSFKQMMLTYARIRGLKRLIIPTPLLAPWLAGHWVGLITPIPNTIARPLINGVISPVLGDTGKAGDTFPNIHPMSYEAAVRLALSECHDNCIETRWCDSGGHRPDYEVVDKEGMIREMRSLYTPASPDHVYRIVSSLGGDRGWLKWSWAWGLRGLLDRIAGGPGLRRGRRHVTEVRTGDAVDFWRVERVVSPHLLRLRAEMRLPGDAWMQWEIRSEAQGTILIQTALFKPLGLAGLLYWYILLPIHKRIFRDLARAIIREAETHIESL
jgi:hypothetical protein